MHVIAINGSPRKSGNTAVLLRKALDGAVEAGASVELIHLYELDYKGCRSCFGCKRKGVPHPEVCVQKDDLSPVLEKVRGCDVLIAGSPIYMGDVTGEMRSFIERLMFPIVSYESFGKTNFSGKINSAFIFTMNMPEKAEEYGRPVFNSNSGVFRMLGGSTEYLASFDTYQFDDYGKYAVGFDVGQKEKTRAEIFPKDCEKAFEIGRRLASGG